MYQIKNYERKHSRQRQMPFQSFKEIEVKKKTLKKWRDTVI